MARFPRVKEYCCPLLHLSSTGNTASTFGRSLIDSMKQTPLWSLLRSSRSLASKSVIHDGIQCRGGVRFATPSGCFDRVLPLDKRSEIIEMNRTSDLSLHRGLKT